MKFKSLFNLALALTLFAGTADAQVAKKRTTSARKTTTSVARKSGPSGARTTVLNDITDCHGYFAEKSNRTDVVSVYMDYNNGTVTARDGFVYRLTSTEEMVASYDNGELILKDTDPDGMKLTFKLKHIGKGKFRGTYSYGYDDSITTEKVTLTRCTPPRY